MFYFEKVWTFRFVNMFDFKTQKTQLISISGLKCDFLLGIFFAYSVNNISIHLALEDYATGGKDENGNQKIRQP